MERDELELPDGITLIIAGSDHYRDVLMDLVEAATAEGDALIYLTATKPYETLVDEIAETDADTENMFFIDAISWDTSGEEPDADNAVFLRSPQNLTDISIAVTQSVDVIRDEYGTDVFLLVDSLSTLSIYNNQDMVSEFGHRMTTNMHEWGLSGTLLVLDEEADDQIIKQFTQFCDHVIHLE